MAGEHLVEALIGGGLALVMTQLLFPLDPIKHVNQAAEPVFNQLADALEQTAAGLAAGDHDRASQALEQARAIDPLVRSFQQALTVGYQVARLAPFRRRALGELDPYASAARQVDYAVRNTRVLARSAMVLLAAKRPAPQGLVAGVRVLAETVRTLGGEVVAREPRRAAQRLALQAAVHAMTALQEDGDLAVAMVVGQVRSTVLDLLRCSAWSWRTPNATGRGRRPGHRGSLTCSRLRGHPASRRTHAIAAHPARSESGRVESARPAVTGRACWLLTLEQPHVGGLGAFRPWRHVELDGLPLIK